MFSVRNILPRKQSRESGFMLVEMMMSIMVVTIAVFAALFTDIQSERKSQFAFERAIATEDAHQILEQIRKEAKAGSFPSEVVAAFPDATAVSGFSNLPSEAVTVSYASTSADPLDVRVQVTWETSRGRSMTTSMRTMVTQRP